MADFDFTDGNFEAEVLKSDVPVMVDFFAEWCGPCKMMAPIVDELAEENKGKWKVGKCDIDKNPELAQKFSVQSIPTVLFFKDGQVVDKVVGFQSKEALAAKLDA